MPIIHLTDGTKKHVKYGKAAEVNQYLNEPEKLKEITDPKELAEKEAFLSKIVRIDWSDIKKPAGSTSNFSANHDEIKRVLNDKSLKGKAKFDAMRAVISNKTDDKIDKIP